MSESDLTAPVASQQLEDQLCLDLYVTTRAVLAAYRPLLDALGLTYPQYLVMLSLWQYGAQTVKALGGRIDLDYGTLSPVLKRLEAAGYLTRTRRRSDEREVEVSLTDRGRELQDRAAHLPADVTCKIGLGRAASLQLRQLLRQMQENLASAEERCAEDGAQRAGDRGE